MNMLSNKVVFMSTSVLLLSAAAVTTDFTVYATWIYNGVVSWLQPPYLYLLINCIIITIVASSKLQSTTDAAVSLPAVQPQLVEIIRTDYKCESVHKGLELENPSTATAKDKIEDSWSVVDDAMSNKENEGGNVVATSIGSNDEGDFVKPSPSARFGHRRNAKGSPEGGRRVTVLGVCKAKKQDTLENTWRTIREGRAIPISRHLKKSDTHCSHQRENTPPPLKKTMRKAETLNDRSVDTGTGTVKKEASLSQEELNRRVEAFINKFNEDMRLQRQDSLKHYTQLLNIP